MVELLGLFLASFAAATLIPLPSEAALYAYLQLHPENTLLAALLFMAIGRLARYIVVAAMSSSL